MFEPNGRTALLGDKLDEAFFVKCDRSTMTQNDHDNGRMICLIGVAALKPVEFVVFRITQWTASATSQSGCSQRSVILLLIDPAIAMSQPGDLQMKHARAPFHDFVVRKIPCTV